MIKKIIVATLLSATASLFAYNPPAGGQNLFRLSSPELLTEASSSAGGAFYNVSSNSAVNNPAITAYEQRIVLNLAGTMLFDGKDESDKSLGSAFEAGLLLPSLWCVSSFLIQGVFVPFYDMHLGNSVSFMANISKDVTDTLAVGISADMGVFYGYDSDWMGGLNLGALYRYGDFSFMKDLRFGASILNLGKTLKNTELRGIKSDPSGEFASDWPALATLKLGAAATLFDSSNFDIGASVDFSFPSFQNFVFDAGIQFMFFDVLKLSSAWEYDVQEFAKGEKNLMPSIGLSCKFIFNSKDGSMLANKGWAQSEMTVSTAWKQLYKNVNAVSAGAKLNLGLKDTQAPEITLWGE